MTMRAMVLALAGMASTGVKADYLPAVGPPPLRFLVPPGPQVAFALPPLDMGRDPVPAPESEVATNADASAKGKPGEEPKTAGGESGGDSGTTAGGEPLTAGESKPAASGDTKTAGDATSAQRAKSGEEKPPADDAANRRMTLTTSQMLANIFRTTGNPGTNGTTTVVLPTAIPFTPPAPAPSSSATFERR